MNKNLKVPDINLILAKLTIEIKSKPTTIQLVLSELIKISENGVIPEISKHSSKITKLLNISPENYRYSISQLNKLGIITKQNNNIFLHPIAKTPFNQITISKL